MPIALYLTVGSHECLSYHDEILVGSVYFRSCAGNRSSCEFLSGMALSCPEGRNSQHSAPPVYINSTPHLAVLSEHQDVCYKCQKNVEMIQYHDLTSKDSDSIGPGRTRH